MLASQATLAGIAASRGLRRRICEHSRYQTAGPGASHHAGAHRPDRGLRAITHGEFSEDVLHVLLDRLDADREGE